MKENGERDTGYGDRKSEYRPDTPKLKDFGVTKLQSSRWQKLGALDDDAFENRVEVAKGRAVA